MYKAMIRIMPKKGILDPQGVAVGKALAALGYSSVNEVWVGKYMELLVAGDEPAQVELQVREMCSRLLSNPVIEDFSFELVEIGGRP